MPAKHRDNFRLLENSGEGEIRTHYLLPDAADGCATNWAKVTKLVTNWSGSRSWRFGRIGKKRNIDDDFHPPFTNKFVGAENNNAGVGLL